MRIDYIGAREIYDSRGWPTVEARVVLDCGASGSASVPSGASKGSHEALEMRDGGKRLMGRGVTKAVDNVRGEIAKAITSMKCDDQRRIDETLCALDGTAELSRLGANAILAVSMACAQAAANAFDMELYRYLGGTAAYHVPVPMMNVINGGAHAANNVDIQEFMLVPVGADTFSRAMRMCAEAYHSLKSLLRDKGLAISVGDEGGFAPDLSSDEDALALMETAIENAGMQPGRDMAFALDVAATEWLEGDYYVLPKRGDRLSRDELIKHIADIAARHPVISIEDPLHEDDFGGFSEARKAMPGVLIVGDDLFVTAKDRVEKGAREHSAGALLVKPNQAGTVTRAMDTMLAARRAGMKLVVSHRSGETASSFIADLAVAANAEFIKAGAPARGERLAKYNRLLAIEDSY